MLNAARNFLLDAAPAACVPMGNGHINRTCLLTDEAGNKYTMQKINDSIFKDVPALMENIRLVTEYLRACDPDPRHSLQLVHTKDGRCFHHDETGYYRVYRFVDESVCLERAETQEEFFLSAQAFGSFQNQLAGFDAAVLSETIPRFHDTANRVNNLKIAAANDKMGRLKEVQAEYEFALAREEEAGVMLKLLKEGKLKLRVTHNDTKLNNVLFDEKTRRPICIIDLDTVMPGLAANDFGDSIRFGAATAAEDEKDLDKMRMDLELYRTFARGFIRSCPSLTEKERETLPLGAKLMTLECGLRFLTDYLDGDHYFAIHRPEHNLDRARTQFKLVRDMEDKWEDMCRIIREETPEDKG